MDNKKIGTIIKELRNSKGFTQIQLAEKASCSRSYVAQVERGAMTPSIETLSDLAKALGVTVSYIMLKAQGADNDDHELIILQSELPEGITLLKEANSLLTKKQKKDLIEFMKFYINQNKKG